MSNSKKLFIFGLGYSSQYIAKLAMEAGFEVYGTCRTQEKCNQLEAQSIKAFLFDGVPPDVLAGASHILSSIPPQEGEDIALPLLPDTTGKWLGYLSTTGVYGDWKGEWVDETSEVRPNNKRLKARVAAEKGWLDCGGHVFRLAGIYGPGRNAIENVRAGTARRIDKPGQVFSRIHVEDIAQTVLASMLNPSPGAIYNVCDDEPAPAHEVISYACELLKVSAPPLVPINEVNLSQMGKEFYQSNRRVRNQRIKEELRVDLGYPTYREGLRSFVSLA
ncbi:MAG: SDR family oxidoreductase [Rickettsiales bacterium]